MDQQSHLTDNTVAELRRRGTIDHPRRGQPVMAQSSDEGLGAPMTKGGFHLEPLPPTSPAPQAGHLGGCASFVDEYQPFRALLHPWLTVRLPHPPCTSSNRDSEAGCAFTSRSVKSRAASSGMVMSPSASTQPTITVCPGARVRIVVHKDLLLRPWAATGGN